jgi:protein phosphatase PTC7
MIPHPAKAHRGGEDAFFIGKDHRTVGVADGVGGWAGTPGADPAKYSRDLMKFCNENAHAGNPQEILEIACKKLDFTILGSTTALVAQIRDKSVHTCNVGDSACALFGNSVAKMISRFTVLGFNFPCQIGSHKRNWPTDGAYDITTIAEGDVLVLGTDGLWDNIWMRNVEMLVRSVMRNLDRCLKSTLVKNIADGLAELAHVNGGRQDFESPFSVEARRAGFLHRGGKLDDVTVVASVVVADNEIV